MFTAQQEDAIIALAESFEQMAVHAKATLPPIPNRVRRPKVERTGDGWALWNVPATGSRGNITGLLFTDPLDAAEAYADSVRKFFPEV